jgi:hypothetical protein
VAFGTGEHATSRDNLGVGHAFLEALLGSHIEGSPDLPRDQPEGATPRVTPGLTLTSDPQKQRRTFAPGAFPAAQPITELSAGSPVPFLVVPQVNIRHFGFHHGDVLVVQGIHPSKRKNLSAQVRVLQDPIASEVRRKAAAMAAFYLTQIQAAQLADPQAKIRLFVYGFSRGGCIAMQAMNHLYRSLNTPENQHLLAALEVHLFLVDPVPGSRVVDRSPDSHTLPPFVRHADILYAAHERRYGFGALRKFVKQDRSTEVSMQLLPGSHSSLIRRDRFERDIPTAAAQRVTAALQRAYHRFWPDVMLPFTVFVRGDREAGITREALQRSESELRTDPPQVARAMSLLYRRAARQKARRAFGMLSPLLRRPPRFGDSSRLIETEAEWPERLEAIEQALRESHMDKPLQDAHLRLVGQLRVLSQHATQSKNPENGKLIQACFNDILLHFENLTQDPGDRQHILAIEHELHKIKAGARHSQPLRKAVWVALAIVASILTLGATLFVLYQYGEGHHTATHKKAQDALKQLDAVEKIASQGGAVPMDAGPSVSPSALSGKEGPKG